jgi:protein-S-isoprenylcysteine O-methyltransferase Ste14
MNAIDITRAACLYTPLCLAAVLWLSSPPARRARAGAFLATTWTLPSLIGVNCLAMRWDWWSFAAVPATLAGFPVDLWLGWALLWGLLPALLPRRVPLMVIVATAVAVDLVAMPQLASLVRLGPTRLVGEAVAVGVCLVPAQLLARWTTDDRHVGRRAVMQMLAFAGLTFALLPQTVFDTVGGSWTPLRTRPAWITGILLQLVAIAGLHGVSALQEFATRGAGTPVPFDPPKRLVLSGPYAYVRNPMQLSAAIAMVGWGWMLASWFVAAAGLMAVIYAAGFAAGDEGTDLERRFGIPWTSYTRAMRAWLPRWRPIDPRNVDPERGSATLYVSEECGPCSEVRAWFAERSPVALEIVAAERHPTRTLRRITYDPGDGTPDAEGIVALGRALEHVHFGWAVTGMMVRLPGIAQSLQLITDASGGAPRTTVRYCDRPAVQATNLAASNSDQMALNCSNG